MNLANIKAAFVDISDAEHCVGYLSDGRGHRCFLGVLLYCDPFVEQTALETIAEYHSLKLGYGIESQDIEIITHLNDQCGYKYSQLLTYLENVVARGLDKETDA